MKDKKKQDNNNNDRLYLSLEMLLDIFKSANNSNVINNIIKKTTKKSELRKYITKLMSLCKIIYVSTAEMFKKMFKVKMELLNVAPKFVDTLQNLIRRKGQNIFLQARLESIDDQIQIIWYKDNERILMNAPHFAFNDNEGIVKLFLYNIEDSYTGNYKVVAKNLYGGDKTEAVLSVIQPLPPLFSMPLKASNNNIREGMSLYMEAQFYNTLSINWFFNEHLLDRNSLRYEFFQSFGFASLTVFNMTTEDSGNYSLHINNGFDESIATNVLINCIGKPMFTEHLNGSINNLFEGQRLFLKASVKPFYQQFTCQWLFNGQPLEFDSRIYMSRFFGLLWLEFVCLSSQDSGTYTCRIINDVGQAESSITLTVRSGESQASTSYGNFYQDDERDFLQTPIHPENFQP